MYFPTSSILIEFLILAIIDREDSYGYEIKTEYIAKLTKYLRKLPQQDYEEAIEYFMEYFEEAGPENEARVIAELGTPKEAAHEVISRLLEEKIVEDKSSLRNKTTILWIAILAVLASPVALPILLFFLAMIKIMKTWKKIILGVSLISLFLGGGFVAWGYSQGGLTDLQNQTKSEQDYVKKEVDDFNKIDIKSSNYNVLIKTGNVDKATLSYYQKAKTPIDTSVKDGQLTINDNNSELDSTSNKHINFFGISI